jgi:hypothetical protein
MPDFKKGRNAYVFVLAMALASVICWLFGQGILWLMPSDSDWRFLVDMTLLDGARMAMAIAVVGAVFSFVGSFFNFRTENAITKTFMVFAILAWLVLIYMVVLIVSGANIFDQPWRGIFFTLVSAVGFLFFLPLFLHTARKKTDDEDFFDYFAQALRKGRAVLPKNDRIH